MLSSEDLVIHRYIFELVLDSCQSVKKNTERVIWVMGCKGNENAVRTTIHAPVWTFVGPEMTCCQVCHQILDELHCHQLIV
jgi:hypothetical protein